MMIPFPEENCDPLKWSGSGVKDIAAYTNWIRHFRSAVDAETIQEPEIDKFIRLMQDPRLFHLAQAEIGSVLRVVSEDKLDQNQIANPA